MARLAPDPLILAGEVLAAKAPGQQQHGLMAAVDTRNGKVVWEKRLAYAVPPERMAASVQNAGPMPAAEPRPPAETGTGAGRCAVRRAMAAA